MKNTINGLIATLSGLGLISLVAFANISKAGALGIGFLAFLCLIVGLDILGRYK